MKLDSIREVETPEGITLHLRLAGLGARSAAWAIDAAVRLGILWLGAFIFGLLGVVGAGPWFLMMFVLLWGYPVLFEVLRDGATIGKRALHLRVVHEDGTPVGWTASFVRNLLRTVDSLPLLYTFGAVTLMFDPGSRRLGDIVARTLVVYDDRGSGQLVVAESRPEPPPLPLEAAEQRAVVAFAERFDRLTPERRDELADVLAPVTGASGAGGSTRIIGWANWIVGRSA